MLMMQKGWAMDISAARGDAFTPEYFIVLGDVRVLVQLILDISVHEDPLVVVAALVFTEEFLRFQPHEVGGDPLGPAHEHGHPQEEDHPDLPRSKLSNCFENILIEKLHISKQFNLVLLITRRN
jgi:hypothetical protein